MCWCCNYKNTHQKLSCFNYGRYVCCHLIISSGESRHQSADSLPMSLLSVSPAPSLSSSKTSSWSTATTSTSADHLSAPETSTKLHHQCQKLSTSRSTEISMSSSCSALEDIIINEILDFQSVIAKHMDQDDHSEISNKGHSGYSALTNRIASPIYFDRALVSSSSNGKICIMSSKGLSSGNYSWTIEILQSDVELQEIGVVSTNHSDLNDIIISDKGLVTSANMKSRSLYGCDLGRNKLWYGSWNDDNSCRCFRDLTKDHRIGWVSGDIIRVVLNLSKWRIKFFLNGKAVCYLGIWLF